MRPAKNIAICLILAIVPVGILACGQSQVSASDLAKLDRVIPRLPRGMSIAEVEQRLGPPRDVRELEGGGAAALYRLWQLVFEPNLVIRERFYKAGYWPRGRPFAPLDHKIRELPLGTSLAATEAELGKTEAWQILDFKERERIWYGNGRWKLSFRNGALTGKKKF
jgi:hypothetical protein